MSNLAQKTVRFLCTKIAKHVGKNHLFEQPNERVPQPPLRFEKPDTDEDVSFSSIEDVCLLYTSPSPRDLSTSRMPSSA